MTFTKWSEIRDEQIERIGREELEEEKDKLIETARTEERVEQNLE